MTNALAIVAHPDDETIWMGGKILHEKKWKWTVLSLCRKDDPDRKPKFFKVCSELNARGFISDLDDDSPEKPLPDLSGAISRIEPIVADKEFDLVFTHGSNGEYGHNRHIEAHRAVLEMAREGLLSAGGVFAFDYLRSEQPFHCEPNQDAAEKFQLSGSEYMRKRHLVNGVYGFREDSFEYLSCAATETFRKVR